MKKLASTILAFTMLSAGLTLTGCEQSKSNSGQTESDSVQTELNSTQTFNETQYFTFPASEYGKCDTKAEIFAVEPFELTIKLPSGWSADIPKEYTGDGITSENSPIRLSVGDTQTATIDFNIFDPTAENPSAENYYKAVYNQLMLGSMASWDYDYTVLSKTDISETACCKIMTPQTDPENYHKGILAYNSELGVYISIYFDIADISDEQVRSIAQSISLN